LTAAREQKATELTPPQRSKMERALYRYDNGTGALPFVLQSWHGFQLASGSFPGSADTGFGTRFMSDHWHVRPAADPDRPDRVHLDAVAAYRHAAIRDWRRGSRCIASAAHRSTRDFLTV
jgi:hypothetical protein